MTDEFRRSHSHLFTVRVWREELGQGQFEWRGKVQHATSGEVHYFRDWPVLVDLLQQMIASSTQDVRQHKV